MNTTTDITTIHPPTESTAIDAAVGLLSDAGLLDASGHDAPVCDGGCSGGARCVREATPVRDAA